MHGCRHKDNATTRVMNYTLDFSRSLPARSILMLRQQKILPWIRISDDKRHVAGLLMTAWQICVSVEYCRPHSWTIPTFVETTDTGPKAHLCMTIGYVTPRGKHALVRSRRESSSEQVKQTQNAPTGHLRLDSRLVTTDQLPESGVQDGLCHELFLSNNVSGSLTIPCGPSRICDGDWMGQSPFAPQFATLVNFSVLVRPASQRAVGF